MKKKEKTSGISTERKETEELYEILVKSSPVGIYIFQDGRFCFVNPKFLKITGYSEAELFTMDPMMVIHPDDRERISQHVIDVFKGKTATYEFRAVNQAGKIRWGSGTSVLITYKEKPALLGTFIEITEAKRAEEALQESEDKYRAIFEQASDSIMLIDRIDRKNPKIVDFNSRAHENLGYTREEFAKLGIADINAFEPTEQIEERVDKSFGEGGNVLETKHRTKSGEIRDVLASLRLVNLGGKELTMAIWHDITESKRAQEALQESEDKFSKALSVSGNAICISSLPDNKFVEINDGYTQFTGYTSEEVIGRTAAELNLWVMDDEYQQLVAILTKNGMFRNMEFHSRMKSGEIRTGLGSAENVNIKGKPHRLVVIQDITERKRAEEKIAESEEKFSKAFRVSPEMVSITSLPGGKFIDANDSFIKITGYASEELIGHSIIELDFWAETDERSRMLQILKEHGRVEGEEFDFRMKSGEIRKWLFSAVQISMSGEPCLIALSIDITERKQAEVELRQSEKRYRLLAENVTDVIWTANLNKPSRLTYISPSVATLSGFSVEEAMAWKLEKIFTPASLETIVKAVAEDRTAEGTGQGGPFGPKTLVLDMYRKDGSIVPVELKSGFIREADGRPIEILVVARDITERKLIEKELVEKMAEIQAANVKLQELDKMKDSFLSTVSHELRTPLTSIKSFAEILLTYDEDKATQREFLTIINEESDRLTKLINDFLDLSKIEAGRMQWDTVELSLTPVIQNAINITQAMAKKQNLNVVFNPVPDLPLVPGDKDRLVQVVTNLLSNSIKFTPDGGTITIGTKVVAATDPETKQGMVVVSMTDTGIGIAPENHALVFEKFKQVGDTLTNKPKGTGLGLPICREIVEHYGGKIWVESELGKGSTFLFSLPIAKPAETNETVVTEAPAEPVEAVKESETILVVDDDVNIRRFLTYELKNKGYKVFEASNGKEAIDLARKQHPDLITLDVQMPDISGFDVTAVLKNDDETRDIPVLILSVIEDKEKAYKLGANDCLAKPFTKEKLIAKVNQLLIGTKKTILVVDDDKSLVKSIKYQLEHRGYSTYVAYDGKDALETIRKHRPDLILLDIIMPVMNGYEVIKALKSNPETADIRIVLMTGIEIDGGRVKALSVGATEYVTKASGFTKLYETIDHILGSKACV
jgi:PAS domain S-box-containing protein